MCIDGKGPPKPKSPCHGEKRRRSGIERRREGVQGDREPHEEAERGMTPARHPFARAVVPSVARRVPFFESIKLSLHAVFTIGKERREEGKEKKEKHPLVKRTRTLYDRKRKEPMRILMRCTSLNSLLGKGGSGKVRESEREKERERVLNQAHRLRPAAAGPLEAADEQLPRYQSRLHGPSPHGWFRRWSL